MARRVELLGLGLAPGMVKRGGHIHKKAWCTGGEARHGRGRGAARAWEGRGEGVGGAWHGAVAYRSRLNPSKASRRTASAPQLARRTAVAPGPG